MIDLEKARAEWRKHGDVDRATDLITALETALREVTNTGICEICKETAVKAADEARDKLDTYDLLNYGKVSRMKARRLLTSWGWVPVIGAAGDCWEAPNCASGSLSCPIEMALEYHGYRLEE